MVNLFEARQIEAVDSADDLHYVVLDPSTGGELAKVSPVAVGQGYREQVSRFERIRRFKPFVPLPEVAKNYVPRVVLQVADMEGLPLFFVDRADKILGHPAVPNCVVVAPDGGVVGHLTSDHDKSLTAPTGPVDAEGLAQISGRSHVRDEAFEVALDIVVRGDLTGKRSKIEEYDGVDTCRLVGRDEKIWARIVGFGSVLHCVPQTPHQLKILLVAHMISRVLEDRLHMAFIGKRYELPVPLDRGVDPYPGYGEVHSSYMRYQEEFVERYREYRKMVARSAAAAASD